MAGGGTKRRFSSPSPSPGGGGGPPSAPASSAGGAKFSGRRMPSPVPSARCWSYSSGGGSGSGSRSSSPVPSKCVVPSLAAAKEERSRKNGREPAIVVPSRYRQPSPVGGRRLSGVGSGGGESGKKKVGVAVVVSGGGGRGLRKSWEEKEKSKVVVDQQAILTTQVAMSQHRLSDDGGKEEQPNNEEEQVTPKIEKQQTSSNKTQVPAAAAASETLLMKKHLATKITVHDPKWTDGSIPFDTVSENLGRLGKEALQRRNAASAAAAAALEEALATESLIRCLSMFSNLCSSSKAGNPLPTIDSFLSIYEDSMKWIPPTCKSLLPNARNEATSTDHITKKPSSIWVDAALATDLQVVSLFDGNFSGKPSVRPPVADSTRSSFSKKSSSSVSKTQAGTWTSGQGVAVGGETLNFAKSLRREMQVWFMRFVEDALDVGFRLFGAELGGGVSDNARVAAILSQLKRVNEWVDGVGTMPEEEVVLVEEKIERLKRKIYGFIITHIESAFDSSVSLTNNKA